MILSRLVRYFGIWVLATALSLASVMAAPLHDSAASGDIDAVRNHLAGGEYINFRDEEGLTALHWAVVKGQYDVAEFLFDNGADINAKDNFGTTCCIWPYSEEKKL